MAGSAAPASQRITSCPAAGIAELSAPGCRRAAAAWPPRRLRLCRCLLLLSNCATHCAGLHSLPAELVEDIAQKKAEAESMRLEFDATGYYPSGGGTQRQVVLERAMNSPVVTLTRRVRSSRNYSGGPTKPVTDVAWFYEHTVHARARLALVLDVLLLALAAEDFMDWENPHCTVSFQMGGQSWGQVELRVQDYDGDNQDDHEFEAAHDAWELAQREAALAHPTVQRMLRVLCDNSAL